MSLLGRPQVIESGSVAVPNRRILNFSSSFVLSDSSGKTQITLDPDLVALGALTGTGIVVHTGSGTFVERTVTVTAGLGISNGSGVSAAPNLYTTSPLTNERVFRAPLGCGSTIALTANTAYFVYMGQVPACTPKYVEFQMTAAGSGAQTAEVGLFSTPSAPNKANQSLTKLVATGTVDTLTATLTVKRNTNAFSTAIADGTYLWAGIRTNLASTQPTLRGIELDFGQGYLLTTATAGALTGAGPWTGALTSAATVVNGPTLRVTLD